MKIIVAPLNWGIGHATRSIPVIEALLSIGASVFLASDGDALEVLKKAFPRLPAFSLPSYDIRYPSQFLLLNGLSMAPKMIRAIRAEHSAITQVVRRTGANIILSDNRFGCRSPLTENIFISHQLRLPVKGLPGDMANKINTRLIQNFDRIWIPDFPPPNNLSGRLSSPDHYKNVSYTGPLSRFAQADLPTAQKKYDFVAILSGPEPMRTQLERKLLSSLENLANSGKKAAIIRGAIQASPLHSKTVEIINFADTSRLLSLIASAKTLISRPGYSTLMDFHAIGLFHNHSHNIIFIPTPGQPEQIYLAKRMEKLGLAARLPQKEINPQALSQKNKSKSSYLPAHSGLLSAAIRSIIKKGG